MDCRPGGAGGGPGGVPEAAGGDFGRNGPRISQIEMTFGAGI